MRFVKENVFSLILLAAIGFASFYFYPQLPEKVPSHYDMNGTATAYKSREFISLFVPMFFGAILVIVGLLVSISPYKFAMPNSRKAMNRILFASGLLFASIHIGLMVEPSYKGSLEPLMSFGAGLFMIIAGNVMGKTERNFFIGIRVPWTIASEENWRVTHRLAAKMMVVFGAGLIALTFVKANIVILMTALFIPVIVPTIYSFIYYRRHEMRAS